MDVLDFSRRIQQRISGDLPAYEKQVLQQTGLPKAGAYTQMLFDTMQPQHMHNRDKTGFFFSKQYMQTNFRYRNRREGLDISYLDIWDKLNNHFGYFIKEKARFDSVIYRLTERGINELLRVLQLDMEFPLGDSVFVDQRGREIDLVRLTDSPYAPLDKNGLSAVLPSRELPKWTGIDIPRLKQLYHYVAKNRAFREAGYNPAFIPEPFEGMQELVYERLSTKAPTYDVSFYEKNILTDVQDLIWLATTRGWEEGQVPQLYIQSTPGRLFSDGRGGANWTGMRSCVRKTALHGLKAYDLSSAQPTILRQLVEGEWPEITNYLNNKKLVRNTIAEETGLPVHLVKETITATTFGASWFGSIKNDILKGLNIWDYKTHWLLGPLTEELTKAGMVVAKKALADSSDEQFVYNRLDKPRSLVNDEGKAVKPNVITAHILQGYEYMIMKTLIDSPWGEDIAVLVHDCVYLKPGKAWPSEKLDAIHAYLAEQTSFVVTLEAE